MKRRITAVICCLVSIMLLLFPMFQSGLYALSTDATVQGSTMVVSGQANPGQWVSVMAERSDGKCGYLGQATADSAGNYSVTFQLNKGTYQARAGAGGQQAASDAKIVTQDPPGDDSGSISTEKDSTVKQASISVMGDSETGMILPATSWQWKGDSTVLQALKGMLTAQGIKYDINDSTGYVRGIGGLSEKKPGYPLSGWQYRLNGVLPSSGADSVTLKNGDIIEWIYTLGIEEKVPPTMQETQLAELLTSYDTAIAALKSGSQILNASQRMSKTEAEALQQKLASNQVVLSGKTITSQGGVISDGEREIIVWFPPNTMSSSTAVNVEETKGDNGFNNNLKLFSSLYHLQPDGIKFTGSVRLAIKIAIPPEVDANSLTPAFYNEDTRQWEAIPGIIDLKNGMVIFDTTHFSYFAVAQKAETRPSPEKNQQSPEKAQTSSSTYDYSEVERNYPWAIAAIKALSSQEIMVGSERGFEPGRVITRAEMAALLQRAIKPQNTLADTALKDVPADAWYYSVMQTAVKAGWIKGYPDKTYHPEAVVNRYEAAGMLYNALSAREKAAGNGGVSFTDYQKAPAWAQPALACMAAEGLMHGYPDGSFGGDKPMNRAQAAVIIWGMLNGR